MSHCTLLVEIGTEELPAGSLATLAQALRDALCSGLAEHGLETGAARWLATPRRLAVQIEGAQLNAPDTEQELLGPPADRARDSDGNWTPAAQGFARKQGVSPDELAIIDTPKGARVGLNIKRQGAALDELILPLVEASLEGLPVPKRMRWGASRREFLRPVQWVTVLLDDQIPAGEVMGLTVGGDSQGHRFHAPGAVALSSAANYVEALRGAHVVVDFAERRELIRDQVTRAAAAADATAVIGDDLLDEVTGLVEWPAALLGSFDPRFLEVPAEALISSMKSHQKYFHLTSDKGELLPQFITVANINSSDPAQIVAGNERVIRPRLADAAFFYDTDRKTPLAQRVSALGNVVFQQKLGTLGDKTTRLQRLVATLAPTLGADAESADRAALLAKTDLVTDLVGEFADLQGIAGRYYALAGGENNAVAEALEQQYWPRFAGDKLPQQPVATALALADRLDTLVGIFGIGQPPTGSRDPFGLRRASLAVLRILVEGELALDLRDCLQWAADGYPEGVLAENTAEQALEYMVERFRSWFEDEGIAVEVFRAVAAKGLSQPLDIQRRVHAVHAFSELPEAQALAAANKRVSNILGKLPPEHSPGSVDATLLCEPAEQALASALERQRRSSEQYLAAGDYKNALATLAGLRAPVDSFFDDVMVMADDPKLRDNRVNLLASLRELFLQVADVAQLAASR